ncbi:hypothetical protein PWT90_06213 [Aphanocladium album]|nr:hypothetical protein PWT90_06213 [Aphanocladium album]
MSSHSSSQPSQPPQSQVQYLAESCKHHAAGAYSYAQRSLDRVVEPDTRRRVYDKSHALASTRPFLFSAAAALATFATLPILLFTIFAVAVAATAVGGAVLFALFWLALGLLVLIPTLGVGSFLALVLWAWAAGSFVVGRAVYRAIVSRDGAVPQQQQQQQLHQQQSQPTTPTTIITKGPIVTETKTLYKQPPPIPQYRPEKKTTNGHTNGHEYNSIGRAA